MIDSESVVDDSGDRPAGLGDLGAARRVIGNRVLSADGSDLGEVVAVILSTGHETCAVGYELRSAGRSDTSFVPISAQMVLSGENLVLPAEATAFVRNDMAGFGAAIASYRSAELENAVAVMATSAADLSTVDDDHQKAAVKGAVTMLGTLSLVGRWARGRHRRRRRVRHRLRCRCTRRDRSGSGRT